jgi:50S ribosomal protein L16 3-hydroxylase
MKRNGPSLQALVQPLGRDIFLRKYFPHRLHVSHGSLRRFSTLTRLNELKSVEAAAHACRSEVRVWARGVDVPVDGVEAMACFRTGMSLYMRKVERFIPAVAQLLTNVASDLGVEAADCRADLLASNPGHGVYLHFDAVDAFNIQLMGSKRWRTAPNRSLVHPLDSYGRDFGEPGDELSSYSTGTFPRKMPAGCATHHMRPGSVIYLPKGMWHDTRVVGTGQSLALIINVHAPNWADRVIGALKRRLLSLPRFRQTTYGSSPGDGASRRRLRDAVVELERLAPRELFSDLHPYLYAVFAPRMPFRVTRKSRGRARHSVRVTRQNHSIDLEFESLRLARAIEHVVSTSDGIHGVALLDRFDVADDYLAGALKLLVNHRLLRRNPESLMPHD